MLIYYFIYLLLAVFTVFEWTSNLGNNQKLELIIKKVNFKFLSIFLIFFAGLRYFIGVDYGSYFDFYEIFENLGNFGTRLEFGYVIFMYIAKIILHLDFQMFLLFFAIVSMSIKFKFFLKYFKYPCFVLLLYFPTIFIVQDFGQIRQGMAVGIIFWAIPAIRDRNFKKFLFIMFLALLFHYSSIVVFPLYWLCKYRLSIVQFFIIYIAGFFSNIINLPNIVVNIIVKVISSGPVALILKYILRYGEDFSIKSYFLSLNTIIAIFLIIFTWYMNRKKRDTDLVNSDGLVIDTYKFYTWMFLIVHFFFSINMVSYRGAYFYKAVELFILYNFTFYFRDRASKFTVFIIIFLYGLMRLSNVLNEQPVAFLNYTMGFF